LTVSGPGSGTCEDGPLSDGIAVVDGGHLDLHDARVRDIHNTPFVDCFHSGHGIRVGDPATETTGSATVRRTRVDDYQAVGILVIGAGSTALIEQNVVDGPGRRPGLASGGVEMVLGASATVRGNAISGNACGSPELGCGPDFVEEFQPAGIAGGGPDNVIERNVLFDNHIGIYVGEEADISHNVLVGNHQFGIALQDGTFTLDGDRIRGGEGGVAVIAAFADTHAELDHVRITRTEGARVQTFECCGFTATWAD
jgi:hypothetical protein